MSELPLVVLSGYYGFGNLGDEALLLALSVALREAGTPEILVPAGPGHPPTAPAAEGPLARVRFLPRFDFRSVGQALDAGAVLVSGGGGLFQDGTSLRSLGYYLAVVELARRRRRPYAMVGQSLGPLRRAVSRRWVGRALRRATGVMVRDSGSLTVARELGVPDARLTLAADLALTLAPPRAPAPARLGLALRPTVASARVVAAVTEWLAERGEVAVGLPFQSRDEPVLEQVLAGRGEVLRWPEGDVGAAWRAVSGCRLLLAERLHAAIFAIRAGVPCLVIDYDPKVRGLAADFALPVAGTDTRLTAAGLAAAAERAANPAESTRLAEAGRVAGERTAVALRTLLARLATGESE